MIFVQVLLGIACSAWWNIVSLFWSSWAHWETTLQIYHSIKRWGFHFLFILPVSHFQPVIESGPGNFHHCCDNPFFGENLCKCHLNSFKLGFWQCTFVKHNIIFPERIRNHLSNFIKYFYWYFKNITIRITRKFLKHWKIIFEKIPSKL